MKTCENCEHREVCANMTFDLLTESDKTTCDHWQGWIKCEDGLPPLNEWVLTYDETEGTLINKMIVLDDDVSPEWVLHFTGQQIIAWRPLPTYEAEQ